MQYRADALQREAHVDIEVLGGTGRKVRGVRVPHTGKGIHVSLECIFAAGLVRAFELPFIAAAQRLFDRFIVSAVQSLGQNRVFNTLRPELVQSGLVCLPGRLGTVDANPVIGSEVQLLNTVVNEPQGELQAFDNPLLNQVVNIKARLELAGFER